MDDLISRQAAIEYFKRIIDATNTDGRYNLGFIDGLEFCINHLSTMPSVQPEQEKDKYNIPSAYPPYSIILEGGKPKKGTWIMNTGLGTLCSNCYYKLEVTGLPSYCPHCGATMEGE